MMKATATRKGLPTKAQAICFVLSVAEKPLTRREILFRVHVMSPAAAGEFHPGSNGDYFLPGARFDGWRSPVAMGLVKRAKRDRSGIRYVLAEAGVPFARAYARWGS